MVALNNESRLTLRTDIALEVIVTLAVLCRFGCRWSRRAAFSWDDGWMVFAWAAYTAYTGLSMASVNLGALGLLDGQGNDNTIGKLEYVATLMFETAHVGAKASLVCLCWRGLLERHLQLKHWRSGILGLCIAWYIACALVTLFHCSPISVTWSPIESPPGCIDIVMFALGYELGSIVCNIAIMYLAFRVVSTLRLKGLRKLSVLLIFVFGSWVIVTSAVRIKCLFNRKDPRDYLILSRIWSSVSAASSIVCANLPTYEPLLAIKGMLNQCLGRRNNRHSWKSGEYSAPGVSSSLRSRRWRKNPFSQIKIETTVSHSALESGRVDTMSVLSTHPLNSIRVNHTIERHESYKELN